MNVKRIGCHELALPAQATPGSAGYDLATVDNIILYPGDQALVATGFAWEIPPGHVGIIKDRSGLAVRHLRTSAGVVDSDYRGEVKVLLRNDSSHKAELRAGERIAQLLVIPVHSALLEEAAELSDTIRNEGGFGHTGR